MMIIYFPFTFIADPVVDMVRSVFSRIAIYQLFENDVPESMQWWAGKGVLDIRVPVQGDEDRIHQACRNYRAWIQSHQGADAAYLRMRDDQTPFFDESFVSQLKTDITKNLRTQFSRNGLESDPLFFSRLFLHAAQTYDIKNWEIHRDLIAVQKMERELFSHLRGGQENDAWLHRRGVADQLYQLEDDKLPGRLQAWSCLFINDSRWQEEDSIDMFLTTSPSIYSRIMEMHPDALEVLRLDAIPVIGEDDDSITDWRIQLMNHIHKLAAEPWTGSQAKDMPSFTFRETEIRVSLSVFLVPRMSPGILWADVANLDRIPCHESRMEVKNTVFGLIQPT